MARILIVTLGIRSHLNAQIAFIERVSKLGHECILCSPAETVSADASASGIQFRHLIPPKGKWTPAAYLPGLMGGRAQRKHAKQRADAVMSGLGLQQILDSEPFDLVVLHAELHEFILVAMLSGVPTATLETHLSTTRRQNVPILSHGFIPSDHSISRLRCYMRWESELGRRRLSRLLRYVTVAGVDKRSVMKRLAASHGRKLDSLADTGQWGIYSFKGVPCLRLTIPDMDFPPLCENPDQIFLGPMIRRSESRNEDENLLTRTRRFVASRPSDHPVILMTLGTIKTLPERIRLAVQAVKGRPVTLLIATGNAKKVCIEDSVPENVFISPWLPVAHLLPSVRIAICHGGAATLHECIDSGVPMLVYSTGFLDQNGNAARIEGLGLGLRGQEKDSAADMWRRISHLLENPDFQRNCLEMRRRFDEYGELQRVNSAINRCLAGPSINPLPVRS